MATFEVYMVENFQEIGIPVPQILSMELFKCKSQKEIIKNSKILVPKVMDVDEIGSMKSQTSFQIPIWEESHKFCGIHPSRVTEAPESLVSALTFLQIH